MYILNFQSAYDDVLEFNAYTSTTGSFTITEIMLLEGTYTTDTLPVFEEYGAMPSFLFPSPVKSVGDNINVFDLGTSIEEYFATDVNGTTIDSSVNISDYVTANFTKTGIEISNYINTGYRWLAKLVNLEKNTDYTISCELSNIVKICGFSSLDNNTVGTLLAQIDTANKKSPQTFNSGDYNYYVLSIYPTANSCTKNIKIEKGTKATLWSPYGKGRVDVEFCNKQLLDKDNYKTESHSTICGFSINLKAGTYTLSSNKRLRMVKCATNSYTAWRDVIFGTDNAGSEIYTFTINEDINSYLWLTYTTDEGTGVDITKDNVEDLEITLEVGSKATGHIPHQSQTYPIYLDKELNGDETVRDRIIRKDGKWCYKFNWGKRIFDGTENWTLQNNAFVITQKDALKVYYGDNQIRVLSNYFMPQMSAYRGEILDLHIAKVIDNNQNQIGMKYSAISTVDEFKNKLAELYNAGTALYVVYQLAEPIYEEITDETLISQLDEMEEKVKTYQTVTNITSDAHLEVTYKKDLQTQLNEIQALVLESGV